MNALPVYTMAGSKSGEIPVPEALWVEGTDRQTLKDAVVAYRANQRRGTASTKTKGEVAGSNKKPWRQKGTGRARAGYRASPIWRGGAVAFGPRPRDFRKKLTRKAARLAFRQAFTDGAAAGAIRVIDEWALEEPKTRELAAVLKRLELTGQVLLVVERIDRTLELASRNLASLAVAEAKDLNVYQLVRHPHIVITRPALSLVEARIARERGGEG